MRWKCGCSYDGTDYSGWQIQKNGQLTVQEAIENALAELFKERVTIAGSGRTDAGVHALEQVFHFDYDWNHGSEKLLRALRSRLPDSIQPLFIEHVSDDFNARFSAVSKRYDYRMQLGNASPFDARYCWTVTQPLDLNALKEGLSYFVGKHDFAAFAANRGKEYESTVRTIFAANMTYERRQLTLSFRADGFMYKMVRSLVGTLVNVAMRSLEPKGVSELLRTKKRDSLVYVAPPQGLYLKKVYY